MTILLVVVAAVMLVIGFVSSSLAPIYVSIICSALAAIVLLVFSRLSKREVTPAAAGGPSPLPGPAPMTGQAAAGGTATTGTATAVLERPEGEGVTVLPADDVPTTPADEPTATVAAIDASFPIAEYDELTVAEILPLLPELDADELDEVRDREQAGKARATILSRIDQLAASAAQETAEAAAAEAEPAAAEQGPLSAAEAIIAADTHAEPEAEAEIEAEAADVLGDEPAAVEFPIADYDELKVSEILPLLSELEDDEIPVVRQREQSGKARATILNKLDSLTGAPAPAPAKAPARDTRKTVVTKKAAAKKATGTRATQKMSAPAKAAAKKTAAKATTKKAGSSTKKTTAKKAAAPAKKASRSTKK